MDLLKRILEIREKGAESATLEDIPLAFNVITQFINTNLEAQKLVKGLEMSMVVVIEGAKPYHLIIGNGRADFKEGELDYHDFAIYSNLISMTELLLGQIDATRAFFLGLFEAEGDLFYMIRFLEILDSAFTLLNIVKEDEREVLIKPETMKKLFEVYARGSSTVESVHIPLFLDVLTAFTNTNPIAQELISKEEQKIQMSIRDVDDYLILISDGKMGWTKGKGSGFTLKLEMDLKTSTEIVLTGDAISAFMGGGINIQGDMISGLFYQELNHMFLEFMGLL